MLRQTGNSFFKVEPTSFTVDKQINRWGKVIVDWWMGLCYKKKNLLLNVQRCLFLPHFYFTVNNFLVTSSVSIQILYFSQKCWRNVGVLTIYTLLLIMNLTQLVLYGLHKNDFSRAFCLFSYKRRHFDIPAVFLQPLSDKSFKLS